jgi:hypothetical protein
LRPFHWRWPTFYQGVIRDGLEVHFQSTPPKYGRAQRDIKDEEVKAKVMAKLTKVREQGYISPGMAESLMAFFEVEKGDDNIQWFGEWTQHVHLGVLLLSANDLDPSSRG